MRGCTWLLPTEHRPAIDSQIEPDQTEVLHVLRKAIFDQLPTVKGYDLPQMAKRPRNLLTNILSSYFELYPEQPQDQYSARQKVGGGLVHSGFQQGHYCLASLRSLELMALAYAHCKRFQAKCSLRSAKPLDLVAWR